MSFPSNPQPKVVAIPQAKAAKNAAWSEKIRNNKFLFISVAVHLLFAFVATVFVVQTITAKRKLTFTSAPPSPNPAQHTVEHQVQMAKKKSMMAPSQAKKATTTGLSKVTLPDMPTMPSLTSIMTPGKMTGMSGAPSFGTAGFGKPSAGGPIPFFGFRSPTAGTLPGIFYDLKQDKQRNRTNMTPQRFAEEIAHFVKSGWNEAHFAKYFQGPNALYASQIFTPDILAEEGPKAFGLEQEVQPSMWCVLYQGRVTAPESGTYHFVGAGDDVLIVRFNGRLVLARCWDNPSAGIIDVGWKALANYDYGFSQIPNGFAKGNAIQVHAGEWCDIEILIGEQPGGRGYAELLIEKEGVQYQKDSKGNPILPIFRLSDSRLPEGSYVPHMEGGPIWSAATPRFIFNKPGL